MRCLSPGLLARYYYPPPPPYYPLPLLPHLSHWVRIDVGDNELPKPAVIKGCQAAHVPTPGALIAPMSLLRGVGVWGWVCGGGCEWGCEWERGWVVRGGRHGPLVGEWPEMGYDSLPVRNNHLHYFT